MIEDGLWVTDTDIVTSASLIGCDMRIYTESGERQ